MLDDRRALDPKVDFPEQRGAVIDQHAVLDSHQMHPFTAQRFADLPLAAFHLNLSLADPLSAPKLRKGIPSVVVVHRSADGWDTTRSRESSSPALLSPA